MVQSKDEQRKKKYTSDTIEWLDHINWDYFLTLTFQYPVKDTIIVTNAVERFNNRLSAKAFGKQSKKRVICFPVMERDGSESSYHVHMIIQDPTPHILNDARRNRFNLRDAIIKSWIQSSSYSGNPALSSKGDEWFKEITNLPGLVEYMTKQLSRNSTPIISDQICLNGRKCA